MLQGLLVSTAKKYQCQLDAGSFKMLDAKVMSVMYEGANGGLEQSNTQAD